MAKFDIQTSVIVPKNIEVPLVRGDLLHTSNIFRVCFEISLSFTSTIIGVVVSTQSATNFHYFTLGSASLATLTFLGLTIFYHRKCKC